MRTHWKKQADYKKRGKTRVTKARLVFVLCLIGWENGTSFLDQSQCEVKQKRSNPELFFDSPLKIAPKQNQRNLELSSLVFLSFAKRAKR